MPLPYPFKGEGSLFVLSSLHSQLKRGSSTVKGASPFFCAGAHPEEGVGKGFLSRDEFFAHQKKLLLIASGATPRAEKPIARKIRTLQSASHASGQLFCGEGYHGVEFGSFDGGEHAE